MASEEAIDLEQFSASSDPVFQSPSFNSEYESFSSSAVNPPAPAPLPAQQSQLVLLSIELGGLLGPSAGQEPRPPTPHELGVQLVRGSEVFGVRYQRGLIVTRVEPGSPAERGGVQVGDEVERLDQNSVIGWSVSQFLDNLPDLLPRATGIRKGTDVNRFELSVRRGPQLRDEVLVCGEQLVWQDTRKSQAVVLGESEEEDEAYGARGRNSTKRKMIKVKAKKKTDKPGFCVVGGADYSTGIYINKVTPGGRGEKAGLREGFEVLEADGQTLRELVHEDAASFIWNNWLEHRKLKLLVRDAGRYPLTRKFKTVRREQEAPSVAESESTTTGTVDENQAPSPGQYADSLLGAPPNSYEQQQQLLQQTGSTTSAQVHLSVPTFAAVGEHAGAEMGQAQGPDSDQVPRVGHRRHRVSSSSSGGTGAGAERRRVSFNSEQLEAQIPQALLTSQSQMVRMPSQDSSGNGHSEPDNQHAGVGGEGQSEQSLQRRYKQKEREGRPIVQPVSTTPRPATPLLERQVSFADMPHVMGADEKSDIHPVTVLSSSPGSQGLIVGEGQHSQHPHRPPSPSAVRRALLSQSALDAIPESSSPTSSTSATSHNTAHRPTDRESKREREKERDSAPTDAPPQLPPRPAARPKLRFETPSIQVTEPSARAENLIYSNINHSDLQLAIQAPPPTSLSTTFSGPSPPITPTPTLHLNSSSAGASSSGEPVYSPVVRLPAPKLKETRATSGSHESTSRGTLQQMRVTSGSHESTTRGTLQRQKAHEGHSPLPVARSASQVQVHGQEGHQHSSRQNPKAREQQQQTGEAYAREEPDEDESSETESEISDSESAVGTTDNESIAPRQHKRNPKKSSAQQFAYNTDTVHKKNAAKEKQPEKRRGSADLLSQSANAEMLKRLRQKRAQLFRKGATVDLGEMPTREEKASSLKPERQMQLLVPKDAERKGPNSMRRTASNEEEEGPAIRGNDAQIKEPAHKASLVQRIIAPLQRKSKSRNAPAESGGSRATHEEPTDAVGASGSSGPGPTSSGAVEVEYDSRAMEPASVNSPAGQGAAEGVGGGGGGGSSTSHNTAIYASRDLIAGPPGTTTTSGPDQRPQQMAPSSSGVAGGSASGASCANEMPPSASSESTMYPPDLLEQRGAFDSDHSEPEPVQTKAPRFRNVSSSDKRSSNKPEKEAKL